MQAESRAHLRELLRVEAGGVVFTTIQKFLPDVGAAPCDRPSVGQARGPAPTLSARRNIVVIADEAHRSQYDFIDGFARPMRDALPRASFIGFTGTPIEKTEVPPWNHIHVAGLHEEEKHHDARKNQHRRHLNPGDFNGFAPHPTFSFSFSAR